MMNSLLIYDYSYYLQQQIRLIEKKMQSVEGPNCNKHILIPTQFICLSCGQHLICNECLKNDHKLHLMVKIKSWNEKLVEFRNSCNLNKNMELLQKQVNRMRQSFEKRWIMLQNIIKQSRLNEVEWVGKQYQQSNGQIEQFLKRNSLFKQLLQGKINEKEAKQHIQVHLMESLNAIRSIELKHQQIISLTINTIKNLKKTTFKFSQILKHPNLQIKEQFQVIKKQQFNDGHSHLALLHQPFTPVKNKVTFKIEKMSNWGGISIGLCILDKVRSNNYFKCWKIGHGIYSIYISHSQIKINHNTLQKYSNSSLKMTQNTLNSWVNAGNGLPNLVQGDQITMIVSYFQEKLKFIRNFNQKALIQIPINLDEGPFYGFIGLSWKGDIIKIIQ